MIMIMNMIMCIYIYIYIYIRADPPTRGSALTPPSPEPEALPRVGRPSGPCVVGAAWEEYPSRPASPDRGSQHRLAAEGATT